MYELIFRDKKLKMTRNTTEVIRQIQETFPGNEERVTKISCRNEVKTRKACTSLTIAVEQIYKYVKTKNVTYDRELAC